LIELHVSHHHITEISVVLITGEELRTYTTGRRVKDPILIIVVGFREVCVVAEATTLQLLHKMKGHRIQFHIHKFVRLTYLCYIDL